MRCDVQPDACPVVEQSPRLDLHRVTVEPVIEVCRDGDPVAFHVLTAAGMHPVGGNWLGSDAYIPSLDHESRSRLVIIRRKP
jgi:hypothetical protein